MTKTKKTLPVGLKMGMQAIAISVFCSPLLVLVDLFIDAIVQNRIDHWSLSGIPYEIYCGGGPAVVLIFFSLPYLLGGFVLAFLARHLNKTYPRWLGSAITGLFSGFVGVSLMAFLWRVERFKTGEWILVGIMEIWSIAIFVWVENRAYRVSVASGEEPHVQS